MAPGRPRRRRLGRHGLRQQADRDGHVAPGRARRLATGLNRLSEADYRTRDFTLGALREALAEVVAAFDRYRTYLPYAAEEARAVAREAVARAKARNPASEPSVYDFVGAVASGVAAEAAPPALAERMGVWVGRFQQYTAPVAAKGVEDTAFYRYARLLALNEVGGEPDHGALDPHDFHAHARLRALRHPRGLLATATHDHKRGEDTRMRLVALAEAADAWGGAVEALDEATAPLQGARGPSRVDRYVVYQTLAALWEPPPSQDPGPYRADLADRLWAYVQKAAREAKLSTSWINPDEAYERDLEAFVRAAVESGAVAEVLGPIARTLATLGARHTVTQTVLKLTSPGVPDLYQGTERLDLSLVDPDNRRPVDYAERAATLDRLGPLLDAPDPDAVREVMGGPQAGGPGRQALRDGPAPPAPPRAAGRVRRRLPRARDVGRRRRVVGRVPTGGRRRRGRRRRAAPRRHARGGGPPPGRGGVDRVADGGSGRGRRRGLDGGAAAPVGRPRAAVGAPPRPVTAGGAATPAPPGARRARSVPPSPPRPARSGRPRAGRRGPRRTGRRPSTRPGRRPPRSGARRGRARRRG